MMDSDQGNYIYTSFDKPLQALYWDGADWVPAVFQLDEEEIVIEVSL